MMNRLRVVVIVSGTALLIAVAVLVAARNRRRPLPPPDAHVASTPRAVQVKAVEGKDEASAPFAAAEVSSAVAIVCGEDPATADRYEARNVALRSIARRRDLPKEDVAALMAYLRTADDAMRIERVAALKNDVMNLLRNQDPPPEGLVETLISMFEGNIIDYEATSERCSKAEAALPQGRGRPCHIGRDSTTHNSSTPQHPPVVVDYCIQHLGAMVNELDDAARKIVRGVFVKAARQAKQPYAGTALYSRADDKSATAAQEGELRRLTVVLCKPDACTSARIAAIQLAGQRGYSEVLPILRDTLSGAHRDAVLDIVAIGSIGLLGNAGDVALLSRFSCDSRRAKAASAAMSRIKARDVAR